MSIDYELDGDVAVLTLDRPDRFNSIDGEMSELLTQSLDRAGTEARALVLTGAGRAFCAGADLAFMQSQFDDGGKPDLGRFLDDLFHPVVHTLLDCPVPTVAALNGVAAGAGLGLALACDVRVMAEDAFLTSAFTAIGLAPDSGTTWWLPHHVGVSLALELTLTNRRVPAEEARALGLCTEVAPGDQVVASATRLAGDLADLVPDSLVTTRRLIRDAAGSTFPAALAAEREEQARLGATPAFAEGVAAFMEKRKPDFRNV